MTPITLKPETTQNNAYIIGTESLMNEQGRYDYKQAAMEAMYAAYISDDYGVPVMISDGESRLIARGVDCEDDRQFLIDEFLASGDDMDTLPRIDFIRGMIDGWMVSH